MPSITAARGTRDILPAEIPVWHWVEQISKEVFESYGMQEIRTPVFESTELFTRSIGDQTDIVSKEMYSFLDRKNRSLTLRPEGTAGIVRAFLQSGMALSGDDLFKVWYSGPMFRYERPQAGRYRQFHQMGAEILGSPSPLLDADVIAMGVNLFKKMGISDLKIKINSVGCEVCRPVIREQIKTFLGANLPHLCEDCRTRFERNPLRILDCKKTGCQQYFSGLPQMTSYLCEPCQDHHHSLLEFLTAMQIDYIQDSRLVRGLDYYNRTVFELISNQLGAQDTLLGGGRYDRLVEYFGGKAVPAIGFAFGVERAVLILESLKKDIQTSKALTLQLILLGESAKLTGIALAQKLRQLGLRVEINFNSDNLKTLFKKANREKIPYVLLLGEQELESKSIMLKKMESGVQEQIPLTQIETYLSNLIPLRS